MELLKTAAIYSLLFYIRVCTFRLRFIWRERTNSLKRTKHSDQSKTEDISSFCSLSWPEEQNPIIFITTSVTHSNMYKEVFKQ